MNRAPLAGRLVEVSGPCTRAASCRRNGRLEPEVRTIRAGGALLIRSSAGACSGGVYSKSTWRVCLGAPATKRHAAETRPGRIVTVNVDYRPRSGDPYRRHPDPKRPAVAVRRAADSAARVVGGGRRPLSPWSRLARDRHGFTGWRDEPVTGPATTADDSICGLADVACILTPDRGVSLRPLFRGADQPVPMYSPLLRIPRPATRAVHGRTWTLARRQRLHELPLVARNVSAHLDIHPGHPGSRFDTALPGRPHPDQQLHRRCVADWR